MSEAVAKQAEAKKKGPGIVTLTITLLAICAVCALLLGLVNMVTSSPIAAAKAEKTAKAMREVLAADSYEEIQYTGGDALIVSVNKAGDTGWVVQVQPTGFGGAIDMMVGVNADGTVAGVSFIKMAETSGLGTNAKKEAFWGQYVGGAGAFAVSKDGGEINAITGATITSRAVTNGVNAAVAAVAGGADGTTGATAPAKTLG